ncbi:helix-turn-helix transcriptional regulator [Streptomyces sp. DG2A-72]|uniref:helix-turn-helix transcriptional regulator n=1 Tax=Streptomyces sp. DG2A-72 TaxID=3051386 RepID=UPI00265BEB79|nr:helix-turn-helix transcriptional regulator [Streptomyces sp. DG2A-72]MDO0936609.1 helix-turn-helix transcriptional regulator [Streptomyces sp. DG2A-72]
MARRRQRLAERRQGVGLTQEALAELLGVDRSTVVRWESGTASPQPWMRPRLACALQISIDELGLHLQEDIGQSSRRSADRESLISDAAQVDLMTTADLRRTFDELATKYDGAPSSSLLAKGGEQLSLITLMARRASHGRAEREILALQADALTLMGQLVWDASQRRDHATARDYYDESVLVARRLRDPTLEGRALLRNCYVALYGAQDPRSGLNLALHAADTARLTSPAVTGLALLHAGEAHAMLGEARECERALAQAQRQLEQTDGMDAAADLVSTTQFGRLAGSCYLSLGQHRRAQKFLEATAAQLQDRRKSRAIVLGNLTLAYIRQREIDAAVTTLTEAIAELEETRGGGGLNVVFSAARELRAWRQEHIVADVHDRLFALMATT